MDLSLINTENISLEKNKNKLITDNQTINTNKTDFQQDEQNVLKADVNIIPLAKENQIDNTIYNRASFISTVQEMNTASRLAFRKAVTDKKDMLFDSVKDINTKDKNMPKPLKNLIKKIKDYTSIRDFATDNQSMTSKFKRFFGTIFGVFGNRSRLADEHKLIREISAEIEDAKAKYGQDEIYAGVFEQLKVVTDYFDTLKGTKKEQQPVDEKARQIDAKNRGFQTTYDSSSWSARVRAGMHPTRDRSDWPLFGHEPCPADVIQGMSGNCFFLSSLASLTAAQVRDMMTDNGDGSVTVRFYEKNPATEKCDRPVYVTVDKKVRINTALDCLWVQIMEKAYCAFCQDKSDNTFEYVKRTDSKGKVYADAKIPKNVIDYGYTANGGVSSEVLSALLGCDAENVSISDDFQSSTRHKDTKNLFREAYLRGNEQTACQADYELYSDIKTLFSSRADLYDGELKGFRTREYFAVKGLRAEILKARKKLKSETDPEKIKQLNESIYKLKENIYKVGRHVIPLEERSHKETQAIMVYERKRDDLRKPIEENDTRLYTLNSKQYLKLNGVYLGDAFYGGAGKTIEKHPEVITDENKEAAEKIIITNTQTIFEEKFFTQFEKDNKKLIKKKNVPTGVIHIEDGKETIVKEERFDPENTVEDYEKMIDAAYEYANPESKKFKKLLKKWLPEEEVAKWNEQVKAPISILYEGIADSLKLFLSTAKKGMKKVTGMPYTAVEGTYTRRSLDYFDVIQKHVEKKRNITIGTREFTGKNETGFAGEAKTSGMAGSHCYTVLDAKVLDNQKRLVLLRNPWGEYSAKYSENNNLLESLAENHEGEGMFWIELNHLMNYISHIYAA